MQRHTRADAAFLITQRKAQSKRIELDSPEQAAAYGDARPPSRLPVATSQSSQLRIQVFYVEQARVEAVVGHISPYAVSQLAFRQGRQLVEQLQEFCTNS